MPLVPLEHGSKEVQEQSQPGIAVGPSPQALAHYSTLISFSFFPGLPSECEHFLCRSNADCPVPTDR